MFGKKKKLFEKDKITTYLQECLETIVESSKKVEELKTEHEILKTYYDDAITIDGLPKACREELFSIARKIRSVDEERDAIERSAVKMPKDKYEFVKENESTISRSIARMSESEKRLSLVKSDLNNLEGEKEALKIEKYELKNKLNVLQNFSKLAIILLMIIFVICIILALVFNFDPKLLVFTSIGIATLIAFCVFMIHRKILKELMITDLKLNKVIGLLNKVKVKYVNVVSTLDYVYKKNNVNSSYELNSLWGSYITSKKDKDIYDMAMDKLYISSEKLVNLLAEYNLAEPEIWVSQVSMLSSEESLKEYRKDLIYRIAQSEDSIEENTIIIKRKKEDIKSLLNKKGIDSEEVFKLMDKYENIF